MNSKANTEIRKSLISSLNLYQFTTKTSTHTSPSSSSNHDCRTKEQEENKLYNHHKKSQQNSCKTAVIISPYRRRDPSRLPRPHFRDLIRKLTQPLLAQAPDPRFRKKEQSLPKIGMRTWIIKVYYKRQNCDNQNSLTQIPWETNQVSQMSS